MREHFLVFSYGKDEHVPIFSCVGSNLKTRNVCKCETQLVDNTDPLMIVSKKTTMDGKEINMKIIYNYTDDCARFKEGTLSIDGKEYPISMCATFSSLQIEEWCYDNIDVVRLPDNIF